MNEVTVKTLRNKLKNEEIELVDVREYAEYAGGRVAGAKLLPLGEIEQRHTGLDDSKPIYVMCRTGKRSAQAQTKLAKLGYKDVTNVRGGFEAWKKESFPIEKDEKAPWAIERQVRFVAGSLVLAGFLLSVFIHSYFIGVSVFIGVGLVFSAVTDTCTMGMILMKMPWNRMPERRSIKVSPAG